MNVSSNARSRSSLAALSVFSLLALLPAACKPAAGDACTKGNVTCADDKTALACQSEKYISVPCKGPKGCAGEKPSATCDTTGNAAGDACSTDDEGAMTCAAGGKAQLACKGGKLQSTPCRGPDGCKGSSCDTSFAEVGDPCVVERSGGMLRYTSVCSVDGKSQLACKDDKRVKDRDCPGPKGCRPPTPELVKSGDWVMCDGSP